MHRGDAKRVAVSASLSTPHVEKLNKKAVDEAFREQRKYTEFCFTRLETKMDSGFALLGTGLMRVERKLDQFIDVQTRTNDLVDRRFRALEQ